MLSPDFAQQIPQAAPSAAALFDSLKDPAIVPFVVYAVKLFVEKVIPNSLIEKIRDQYVPLVAMVGGVLITSVQSGQVDWTQGPLVGLTGVGLHQLFKQLGIIGANETLPFPATPAAPPKPPAPASKAGKK